jgi:hypothetical protein
MLIEDGSKYESCQNCMIALCTPTAQTFCLAQLLVPLQYSTASIAACCMVFAVVKTRSMVAPAIHTHAQCLVVVQVHAHFVCTVLPPSSLLYLDIEFCLSLLEIEIEIVLRLSIYLFVVSNFFG